MKRILSPLLAIDDNSDDLLMLEQLLRRAGCHGPLDALRNRGEGIAWLESELAAASVPRLVFLDLTMPAPDGLEILRWMRAQARFDDTAIVMLSSSSHPRDITAALRSGAQCYLLKHPSPCDMAELLRNALAFVNEPASRKALFRFPCNRLWPAGVAAGGDRLARLAS